MFNFSLEEKNNNNASYKKHQKLRDNNKYSEKVAATQPDVFCVFGYTTEKIMIKTKNDY